MSSVRTWSDVRSSLRVGTIFPPGEGGAWSPPVERARVRMFVRVWRVFSSVASAWNAPPTVFNCAAPLTDLMDPATAMQWASWMLAQIDIGYPFEEDNLRSWRGDLCRYALQTAARAASTGRTLYAIVVDVTIHTRTFSWLDGLQLEQVDGSWVLPLDVEGDPEEALGSPAAGVSPVTAPLKLQSVSYGGEDHRESSCSICLVDFEIGTAVTKTACSHTFHSRCLEKWLHQKPTCPLCRSDPIAAS